MASSSVKLVRTLEHEGKVHSVAFSPDGRFLAATGQRPAMRPGQIAEITKPLPSTPYVVTMIRGMWADRLKFWDTRTWKETRLLGGKDQGA